MSDALNPAIKEAKKASSSASAAVDHAERSFTEAMTAAEKTLAEATKTAEKVFKEGLEALRAQTRTYTDTAGQQVDEAGRYVSERVRERPITATLAGLGVGVLLGLLLAGNRSGHNK